MKYAFPTGYGEKCILVAVDAALIPLVSGALRPFEQRYSWLSEADYEAGYNAFAQLQVAMANNCLVELVESNNRLYRLLDTALNGTQYSASAPDPVTGAVTVTPDIPVVPPAGTSAPNAMRAHIGRLHQLAENAATGAAYPAGSGIDGATELDYNGSWRARLAAVQGEINEGWFGIGGQPARLSDLVNALRVGSDGDAERVTQALDDILSGSGLDEASQAANIFGTVRSLFTDVADVTAEGGILATLIASSLASSAISGILAGQIDRLIAALDGGGLVPAVPAPAGTVLGELTTIRENI